MSLAQSSASADTRGLTAPIVALLPPGPGQPLEEFGPVLRAQLEVDYYNENTTSLTGVSEVTILSDPELHAETVELLGAETRLVIPVKCDLPYLVMHVKDLEKFFTITLKVVDQERRVRTLEMATKLTATRIAASKVSMPLVLEPGRWNHLCIDMPDMVSRAFGASFQYCKEIVVTADCALARMFFQDRMYEDVELPPFLRVVDPDDE